MRWTQRIRATARRLAGDRGRGVIRRAALRSGARPRVNWAAAHSVSYPGGRRAAVVISADLELAWAWRYARLSEPLEFARRRASRARRNVSAILDLCDSYALPITWATVGHLFLDSCGGCGPHKHPELLRVPYFRNELWDYRHGDWFDHDPAASGINEHEWYAWYGPDLIRDVLSRRVAHEIGCHTFSHVVCTDQHCPPSVALSELRRCQTAAEQFGITLRSFVFPGNLAGNERSLSETGFIAYRHRSLFELDVPRKSAFGLWQIPEGISLEKPFASWTAAQQLCTVQQYIDTAIEHGLTCGLWFHAETDWGDVDKIFPKIFAYIAARRSDVWVATMGELAGWLETQSSAEIPTDRKVECDRPASFSS
jgi:Polysaccharide deacetylase